MGLPAGKDEPIGRHRDEPSAKPPFPLLSALRESGNCR